MEEKLKKYWPYLLAGVAAIGAYLYYRSQSTAASTDTSGGTTTTTTTNSGTDTSTQDYNLELQAAEASQSNELQGLGTILSYMSATQGQQDSLEATNLQTTTNAQVKQSEYNTQLAIATQQASVAKNAADVGAVTSLGSFALMAALGGLFSYQVTMQAAAARQPYTHGLRREGGPN